MPPVISQQVSSLSCVQWLNRKCTTDGPKYVEIRDPFCIQLFAYTFCMNFVYKMFVYKMYPTFRQTFVHILYAKFSWHSSFDFVCKMYTKVCWNVVYIFYIHFGYISCIHLVQFLYSKSIHSFRVGNILTLPKFSPPLKLNLIWQDLCLACFLPARFMRMHASLWNQNKSKCLYILIFLDNPQKKKKHV